MNPASPLVDIGPSEEANPETFGGAIPQVIEKAENFAENEDVIKYVEQHLLPYMRETVDNRAELEEEWNSIRRMEMQRHDGGRCYIGPSDKYLPLFNKALGTRVSVLCTGLFPTDDYMEVGVRSELPEARAAADAVERLLQWEFETNANVQQNMKVGLRPLEAFGNTFYKAWYDKKKQLKFKGKKGALPGLPGATPEHYVSCEGLRLSARPTHNVYVAPVTASSLEECDLIFENVNTPNWKIEMYGKAGEYKNWEQAIGAVDTGRHFSNQDQQLTDSGLSGSSSPSRESVLTEVWTYMPVPKSVLRDGEHKDQPVPVRLLLANGVLLLATRNLQWHQKPPYFMARTNIQPGFIYGYGIGRIVRDLQYLANDAANQGNDCATYVLNPVSKFDLSLVAGPLLPIKPGRAWYFSDIAKGHMFDRPPTDLIPAAQSMLNLYISMLADYSGAPPVLQGTGAGGGGKTATGAQILQRNAHNPLQGTIEDLELDVMTQLMRMAWMLNVQYRDEAMMIEVGGENIRFDPQYLDIDPEFRWLASSQAASQQQRASQGLQLIQLLGGLQPALQAQGKIVDFEYLISRLAKDALGYRGFENVIKPAPMPMMGMGMPGEGGPPGMPPGGEEEPMMEEPRSAMPGVGAGEAELVPGEGEAFGEVRNEADEMAALMGQFGGGAV